MLHKNPSNMFVLENIRDGENVYQRCLLISGRCTASEGDSHVEVTTTNDVETVIFPSQTWPMCQGWFKVLVILSPGPNKVSITSGLNKMHFIQIRLQYTPLLQNPPLHLAIMVARDSPLLIDCPPRKFGALSSAHSGLDAAIAKFRTTAYMWQALTAEEFRFVGLGRRSFRLEEEWAADTLSRSFGNDESTGLAMQSTAKVHLIRTDKTVAELRDAQVAQQNENGTRRNELHQIFSDALKKHGGPFVSEAHPVVAGLILDSHYDSKQDLILGHAALGSHNSNGLSLGMFGSHLTYSWPRFMEEIPDCLLDVTRPGDTVGNDNKECWSMWEACSVGQGAFLHEVGHAFSAPHTTGIMARGYSKDWPKCFLANTACSSQARIASIGPVTKETPNDCHWDIRDLLRFLNLPHFGQPSDRSTSSEPTKVDLEDDEDFTSVNITSEGGIAQVLLNGKLQETPTLNEPAKCIKYTMEELESKHEAEESLSLEVLAMNGKHHTIDLWKFISSKSYIRVPGTSVRLQKKSASNGVGDNDWTWAVMLKKRSRDGTMISASKVDLRVGCGLDGAEVYYKDGTKIPCGPRGKHGRDPGMGGHQSRKLAIPKGVDIVKVSVNRGCGNGSLQGLRMWLSNGNAMGALNKGWGSNDIVETLVPGENQKIIGFHGASYTHGMCVEFGIVTAPTSVELPDSVYDLPELQNTPEAGSGGASKKRTAKHDGDSDEEDMDESDDEGETSEDEDDGYDYEVGDHDE